MKPFFLFLLLIGILSLLINSAFAKLPDPLHCLDFSTAEECYEKAKLYIQKVGFAKVEKVVLAECNAVKTCPDIQSVSDFLEMSAFGGGALDEYKTEIFFQLAALKTKCLLDALLITDEEFRMRWVEQFKDPMFEYGEATPKALEPFCHQPAYKKLLDSFCSNYVTGK